MSNYRKILIENYPDKKWTAFDNCSYDEIDWVDQDAKPGKATLDALSNPSGISFEKNNKITLIKTEAGRRIVKAYPSHKQINHMKAVILIQNKELIALKANSTYTLTSEELATMSAAATCNSAVDAIRDKSNELEASLDSMTLAQLEAFDPTNDSNWS